MANEKREYIYSKLSGFNIYLVGAKYIDAAWALESFTVTGLAGKNETEYRAVVAYKSNEAISEERAAWFADIIRNPVSTVIFEWPIDLFEIKRGKTVIGCLVYRNDDHGNLRPIKEFLYQRSMSRVLDWRNPFALTVCKNFSAAMATLHANGYIYNDFNIHNILFDPQRGEVYLKFTQCLRRMGSASKYDRVDSADIAPEFAPPSVYQADEYDGFMTKKTDYYQMTAMLFRMMIGRLPYEGRDLISYGVVFDPEFDTDENAHKYYFQHYHQYPHFIFDESDRTNSLSSTSDNDLPKERWAALPETVKRMFRDVLCQYTTGRTSARAMVTPTAWLEAISQLGEAHHKA